MSGFKATSLWQKAFESANADFSREERIFFQEKYLSMREKASIVVNRIGADLPEFTIHDISHLDALWEMASLISGDELSLNPAEAFVFGGAVLLHDAAMSVAAYPGGKEEIRTKVEYQDSYARLMQSIEEGRHNKISRDEVDLYALKEALRLLHAKQAVNLGIISWDGKDKHPVFLIDDPEIRNFYGSKIGQIAGSHWWDIQEVEDKFSKQLGAFAGRTQHKVDLIKVACLLRIADAMHLDRRRAPAFARVLVNPQGISDHHWLFQERMATPFIEGGGLVYTAQPPFKLDEADAWWIAYDTLQMVDRELSASGQVLENHGHRLVADQIKGVQSPRDLSKYIETEGWQPVDSQVRITDVPNIVSTLGGAKLYGDDPRAAMRELIQNSADAIQARRRLESRPPKWGTINVSIEQRGDGYWLAVEDTGIGMSERVLTGPLLDFGNSFWRSSLSTIEFPGLASAGMSATGKYGIGFFSVFMLGGRVRVTSRRYDQGKNESRTLEFSHGLRSRPILYATPPATAMIDPGTRIEVKLDVNPNGPNGLLYVKTRYGSAQESLTNVVAGLALSLGVEVTVNEDGRSLTVINPEDWIYIDERSLLKRVGTLAVGWSSTSIHVTDRLRELRAEDGTVYGRAAIDVSSFSRRSGCITVGGFRAASLPLIAGVLLGMEATAARNSAVPMVPPDVLAAWATEQAQLIAKSDLDDDEKARAAQIVLMCGGSSDGLPIVYWKNSWINEDKLRNILRSESKIAVNFGGRVTYEEDSDDVHPREFESNFEYSNDVISMPDDIRSHLYNEDGDWPLAISKRINGPKRISSIVRQAISDTFGECLEDDDDIVVGQVGYSDITRYITIFSRT